MKNKVMLVFLLFFIFPFFAVAEEKDPPRHIYGVEEFKVNPSNDVISINGYSFISHMDNWGDRNLSTFIVVYTGDWKEEYKNESSCRNNPNCYIQKASSASKDFWGSRCIGKSCKDEEKVKASVNAGHYNIGYQNGNTKGCSVYENEGGYKRIGQDGKEFYLSYSSCLYYNVGFNISLDLKYIFKNLSNVDKGVNFRIVSKIYIEKTGFLKYWHSPFGIYSGVCKLSDEKKCVDDDSLEKVQIKTNSYNFIINGLSKIATFDASAASARQENAQIFSTDRRFVPGSNYQINKIKTGGTISYKNSSIGGPFEIPSLFYELKSCVGSVKKISNGGNPYFEVFPCDSGETHWIAGDRIQVVGDLSIKEIKPNLVEKKCEDLFQGAPVDEKKVDCGENGNYNQCKGTDIIGTVYYPSPDCNNSSKCPLVKDGVRYAKVDVKTKVLFDQEGTFSFGKVSPTTVRAGKGFKLGNTIYNNKITWAIAYLNYDGSPYYNYGKSYGLLDNGSHGEKDINTSDSQMVYYKDINGNYIKTNLRDASFEAISVAVSKKIKKEKITEDNEIKLLSCDSNDSKGCSINNPNYNVVGNWSLTSSNINNYNYNGKRLGKVITNNYEYKLANSFVMVNGSKAKNVVYGSITDSSIEYVATGRTFYSDFNWDYNKDYLPFNLKEGSKVSLLDFMDWDLSGSCKINVVPGTPSPPGGGDNKVYIKYRSIDVVDPFPKGENTIAKNWKEWYRERKNRDRISNSYNNGVFYSITLSKLGNNETVKISDVNKVVRHYKDMTGISLSGTSSFIKDYFNKYTLDDKGFCKLGEINSDCDTLIKVGG